MAVAAALREVMLRAIDRKEVWPIPTEEVKNNQEPSGFPFHIPLSTKDAALLSNRLRSDYFIEGSVAQENGQYRIEPRLVVAEEPKMVQPLPSSQGRRPDHAARPVVDSYREVRKSFEGVEQCMRLVRDQKFQEAIAPAKAAIAVYPRSTLARICLASAYELLKYPPDSIIPVISEVLALDPTSHYALSMGYNAYKAKGDFEKSIEFISRLLLTDPNNVDLQAMAVNDLAASRQFTVARRFIDDAVEKNPGDPDLLKLRFRILLATESYKEAISAGEELIRTDTSATDTTFFRNLASAYKADSQPRRAAETIARAIAKYPRLPVLQTIHSQYLREAGDTAGSIAAARRAIELDSLSPGAAVAHLTIAETFLRWGKPDSVGPEIRSAVRRAKTADDTSKTAQFALALGGNYLQTARADSAPDRVAESRRMLETAISWFAYSDSLAPAPLPKFQQGYAAFMIAHRTAQEIAATSKEIGLPASCELSRMGQTYTSMAQQKLTAGGSASPGPAGQLLMSVLEYVSHYSNLVKNYCK
jgi:tetratricopeptide (TPR) repeat protein